jgi:hypothetical protein
MVFLSVLSLLKNNLIIYFYRRPEEEVVELETSSTTAPSRVAINIIRTTEEPQPTAQPQGNKIVLF